MHIDSSRLRYQPIMEDDWPFFLSLYQDEAVMRFVSDVHDAGIIRRHAFDVRLPRWQPGSKHWLCLVMREKTSGDPVGVTGFVDREHGIAEVGFLLAAAFQGKGYGAESLRAVCQLAFALDFRKLTASVTVGNHASKAVLEKAGFRLEGVLRENYHLHGRWQDDWVFGLLRTELTLG
ncbi:GNAT family N-acetyltransferase [Mixta calida]|uniref:N-acetyltransferase n=1 Tax=Mixta calida TaxID=665913 RepID=A0ABM6S5D7_9GAMM|nr:GNAT family protein [Mixta calida]AUY26623.1 N-acetyltransferase [Mixta calida]KAF0859376.1 N-acetyltransferase GCN5 [Mixta calida B021323]MDU5768902.1 GNAT family protein [Mixta calida]MDU5828895.1 GNAT family protein [Mixta calida]MDU6415718.1 GNAT family protein [Mixta calida]